MSQREGFHAHDGWYFRRDTDGHVTIEVTETAQVDAPLARALTVDPDTWASIVASVSASGEDGQTWQRARDFHAGSQA